MKKMRFLYGKRWFAPPKATNQFDSESYEKQERQTAIGWELTSFISQVFLVYLVASALPIPFWFAVAVCIVGEFIMRTNVAAASRCILALKDAKKKADDIKGRKLMLPNSYRIVIVKAAIWVIVWGGIGLVNQNATFQKSLGQIEYTQAEKAQLEQAQEQFQIDSTKAVNLLESEKGQISKQTKQANSIKATYKQKQIEAAQNNLAFALRNNDLQGEISARQQLERAKAISISPSQNDFTQAENDFRERLTGAKTVYAKVKENVLKSANGRNAGKSFSHLFEISIFGLLVVAVALSIYMVEEYKKLSDLDHFGLESIFANRKQAKEVQTIYEDVTDRSERNLIFQKVGVTEGSLKGLKVRDSPLLNEARDKFRNQGYELYFKGDGSYPYLKKIKKVAA